MAQIVDVAEGSFEAEVIKSDLPVLLEFWAPWSAPSKQIAEILKAIAEEYEDRAKIAMLNTDDWPGAQAKFAVRSIPTLTLYKNGNAEATKAGIMSKAQVQAFISTAL
ncbi:thioredoxin family protein [Kitasatospora sp. NPDC092948]|uniref:thioredoxin family protein n=1 Tax=Kitasatospora sp. NPDC092948 TaxID=3364088 RepID=UPI00380D7613